MAGRFKAWVCCRSLAGIVGSNPARGMDVCVECCVLSGRGLCDELITRPEESYRIRFGVSECDREAMVKKKAESVKKKSRRKGRLCSSGTGGQSRGS